MKTFKEHAQRLANSFELATRDNGQKFWRKKQSLRVDDSISDNEYYEILQGLCLTCHYNGSILPNDWIYNAIVEYCELATNYDDIESAREALSEDAESLVDIYTSDLLTFLTQFVGHEPFEEYIETFGADYDLTNGLDALACGM